MFAHATREVSKEGVFRRWHSVTNGQLTTRGDDPNIGVGYCHGRRNEKDEEVLENTMQQMMALIAGNMGQQLVAPMLPVAPS